MAPSSSGPGHRPLTAEITGSNPVGATMNEARNYLSDGFSLFCAYGPNLAFLRVNLSLIPLIQPM